MRIVFAFGFLLLLVGCSIPQENTDPRIPPPREIRVDFFSEDGYNWISIYHRGQVIQFPAIEMEFDTINSVDFNIDHKFIGPRAVEILLGKDEQYLIAIEKPEVNGPIIHVIELGLYSVKLLWRGQRTLIEVYEDNGECYFVSQTRGEDPSQVKEVHIYSPAYFEVYKLQKGLITIDKAATLAYNKSQIEELQAWGVQDEFESVSCDVNLLLSLEGLDSQEEQVYKEIFSSDSVNWLEAYVHVDSFANGKFHVDTVFICNTGNLKSNNVWEDIDYSFSSVLHGGWYSVDHFNTAFSEYYAIVNEQVIQDLPMIVQSPVDTVPFVAIDHLGFNGGDAIEVIAASGNWLYVSVTNDVFETQGWVHRSSLCAHPYTTCN